MLVTQERSFQSKFSGDSNFTFHFNEEHVYFTQWNNRVWFVPYDGYETNQMASQILIETSVKE